MARIVNGTLVKHTNKANVFRMPDGSVVKQYLTDNAESRVRQDKISLEHIQNAFGKVHYRGWDYRIVQTLWFDCERALVCMENAPGRVVAEIPKSRLKESEYHAGVWLALYHDRVLAGDEHGFIYTDFTIHNVLIDFQSRSVVAIDPGALWPRKGNAYEDLVKHIHSAAVGLLAKRFASPMVIFSFLRGYAEASKNDFDLSLYLRGLFRESTRQFMDYARSSRLRCLVFPLWVAMLCPLYLGITPAYLSRKTRTGGIEK